MVYSNFPFLFVFLRSIVFMVVAFWILLNFLFCFCFGYFIVVDLVFIFYGSVVIDFCC
jgi:hypothetical protein